MEILVKFLFKNLKPLNISLESSIWVNLPPIKFIIFLDLIKNDELAYKILEKFDDLGPFKSREFKKNPLQAITQSFLPFLDRLHDELLTLDGVPKAINLRWGRNELSIGGLDKILSYCTGYEKVC